MRFDHRTRAPSPITALPAQDFRPGTLPVLATPATKMTFEERKLYGGAMTVQVPDNFYDVSDVRQVPDTQEVFQEREGIHNLIFDILEHVDHIEDPVEAARYHLEDYVDGDGDLTIWNLETIKLSQLPEDTPAMGLLATTPPKDGKTTAIFMVLIRLKKHATDLVITTNLHNVSSGDASDYDDLFQDPIDADFRRGKDITQQVLESFQIDNYDLFHPEDA